ncbi:hypothetical protein Tco_0827027, partial [Tanacetum coccineum]
KSQMIRLKYLDEDNDLILFSSNDDMEFAKITSGDNNRINLICESVAIALIDDDIVLRKKKVRECIIRTKDMKHVRKKDGFSSREEYDLEDDCEAELDEITETLDPHRDIEVAWYRSGNRAL